MIPEILLAMADQLVAVATTSPFIKLVNTDPIKQRDAPTQTHHKNFVHRRDCFTSIFTVHSRSIVIDDTLANFTGEDDKVKSAPESAASLVLPLTNRFD